MRPHIVQKPLAVKEKAVPDLAGTLEEMNAARHLVLHAPSAATSEAAAHDLERAIRTHRRNHTSIGVETILGNPGVVCAGNAWPWTRSLLQEVPEVTAQHAERLAADGGDELFLAIARALLMRYGFEACHGWVTSVVRRMERSGWVAAIILRHLEATPHPERDLEFFAERGGEHDLLIHLSYRWIEAQRICRVRLGKPGLVLTRRPSQ